MDASPGEANNSALDPVLEAGARAREQAFPQHSQLSADQVGLDAIGQLTEEGLLDQFAALLC